MISNSIDIYVGGRLKKRRLELGRTIAEQAAEIGVDSSMIEAYESGMTRVYASDLFRLMQSMDIRPAYVFEELVGNGPWDPKRPASDHFRI